MQLYRFQCEIYWILSKLAMFNPVPTSTRDVLAITDLYDIYFCHSVPPVPTTQTTSAAQTPATVSSYWCQERCSKSVFCFLSSSSLIFYHALLYFNNKSSFCHSVSSVSTKPTTSTAQTQFNVATDARSFLAIGLFFYLSFPSLSFSTMHIFMSITKMLSATVCQRSKEAN